MRLRVTLAGWGPHARILVGMAKREIANLESRAESIRAELRVPKQNEVFKAAVEVGYLTALADGEVDDEEKAEIVRAVEILSAGAVLVWGLFSSVLAGMIEGAVVGAVAGSGAPEAVDIEMAALGVAAIIAGRGVAAGK